MNIKSFTYLFLGWLIPGSGHLIQKKYWRGAIFFVCIACMTGIGLIMGGRIYSFQTENPLTILAFLADIGSGFIYFLSQTIHIGTGNIENVTFEYGTAYLAGAGLLNYLVALDAFDIALGKKE